MRITFEVPDALANKINKQELVEICLRNKKKRFKEFGKVKVIRDDIVKDGLDNIIKNLGEMGEKADHNIKAINNNMDKLVKDIDSLSSKADKIISNSSKYLDYLNLFVSCVDVGVSVAGFMMISGRMDEISKELGAISHSINSIVRHQELLDQQSVKALMNEYANIQNKESLNVEVTIDQYYELVNKMSLLIETLKECFINDVGNRTTYISSISALLPLYVNSIINFDKAHYFTYGKLHANRETYTKILDDFIKDDFLSTLMEYNFLLDNPRLTSREAYDASFAYMIKINEIRVAITDNIKVISMFDDIETYNKVMNNIDTEINTAIIQQEHLEDTQLAKVIEEI